ncbi:hypothetical protein L3Q82_017654 [Scortum barcoo]|uniref:Uncharacterized protein n=1 Tax=Scortum barcoo TaxID=214431 RepID=A0ACB8VLQ9_9TELE|nr:hypothetical protein L3Q82_017654 [Scortum barcoo]
MASLMDPRFCTTYIDPAKVEHIKERVVTELRSLLPTEPGPAVQVRQEEEEGGATAQPGPAMKKRRSLSSFFPKKALTPSLSQADRIRTELATYLLISKISEDADPLQWWNKHEENIPRLSKLAKKYLSIPVMSAPSERLVTCHRASLKPDAQQSSQDTLNGAPVVAAENPGVHVEPPQSEEEEEPLSDCHHDGVFVVSGATPPSAINSRFPIANIIVDLCRREAAGEEGTGMCSRLSGPRLWDKTTPTPISEASTSTTNCRAGSD